MEITSENFEEGGEIPKYCGYKHENEEPTIIFNNVPEDTIHLALIMDDPDAMAAVGKVWVHWLEVCRPEEHDAQDSHDGEYAFGSQYWSESIFGKNDFGEIDYGGPAPPDKRHTYVFKGYALDYNFYSQVLCDPAQSIHEGGFSKQELEDAMKGHILAEAKLTGTFAP